MPTFEELSLMPVNAQWPPLDNVADLPLIDRLVRDARRFTKGRRYNLPSCKPVAIAVLLDATDAPIGMWVATDHRWQDIQPDARLGQPRLAGVLPWVWNVDEGPMPALPAL